MAGAKLPPPPSEEGEQATNKLPPPPGEEGAKKKIYPILNRKRLLVH